jgi:hypothetical protein
MEQDTVVSTAVVSERKPATALCVELEWQNDAVKIDESDKVRELIEKALDLLTEQVLLYHGTVAWFTANGFIALFGNEVISTPCAEEMAAFDQFVTYLQDKDFDHVIFDTAPTGHTLRELAMPFDWSGYMSNQIQNRRELSAVLGTDPEEDIMDSLRKEKERYDNAVKALSDDSLSSFNLVLLPEKLPLEETARRELVEETHLKGYYLEQLKSYGDPDRDPRTRVVTVAYFALVPWQKSLKTGVAAGDDAKEAGWFSLRCRRRWLSITRGFSRIWLSALRGK